MKKGTLITMAVIFGMTAVEGIAHYNIIVRKHDPDHEFGLPPMDVSVKMFGTSLLVSLVAGAVLEAVNK